MATAEALRAERFTRCVVRAVRLSIQHPGDVSRRFCRLTVDTSAPSAPGVYAWEVDGSVRYVGKAKSLIHVVQGARLQRAFNDYTYIPPSKVAQKSSPRVRVNSLLNEAFESGSTVRWWWRREGSETEALVAEAQLIRNWAPPWNLAQPGLAFAGGRG